MKATMNRKSNLPSMLIAACLVLALGTPLLPQGGPPGNPPRTNQPVVVEPATAEEAKGLAFMREEEKLARDVYRQLYARWNLSVFDRIARSEDRHFDSIGVLLSRYGVNDPAANDLPGVFAEPRLASLYSELIAKGSVSLKDALEVGLLIEKQDIADLENELKAAGKADIKRVYTNLLDASLNHQEAFETNLELLSLAQ